MKIVVSMPWGKEISKNHNRAQNGHYKDIVEGWMDRLGWEVRAAMIEAGVKAFEPPVKVMVDFYYPDRRKRDSHNYFETICDALKGVVGVDDDQIKIEAGTIAVCREAAGFVIHVMDEEAA